MSDGAFFLGGPGHRNFAPHSEVPILPVPALPLRVKPRGGRILAEFTSARDARMYASLKRDEGLNVTVMPSLLPQFLVCVRLLEPAL